MTGGFSHIYLSIVAFGFVRRRLLGGSVVEEVTDTWLKVWSWSVLSGISKIVNIRVLLIAGAEAVA